MDFLLVEIKIFKEKFLDVEKVLVDSWSMDDKKEEVGLEKSVLKDDVSVDWLLVIDVVVFVIIIFLEVEVVMLKVKFGWFEFFVVWEVDNERIEIVKFCFMELEV